MRFLMIDRILEWRLGQGAVGIKAIALSEDFFEDHFPLKPIMPGALILEGMAQLSGLLIEDTVRRDRGENLKALMSMVEKAKFRYPAYPGDTLRYAAKILSINEQGARAEIKATTPEHRIAEATLLFSFHTVENPRLEERREEVLSQWLKGALLAG